MDARGSFGKSVVQMLEMELHCYCHDRPKNMECYGPKEVRFAFFFFFFSTFTQNDADLASYKMPQRLS